jgi:hypothetical protein
MRKLFRASAAAIAVSLSLANCANVGNVGGPCADRPLACLLAGAAVIAAVAYIGFYSDDDGDGNAGSGSGYSASDARLKRDIVYAMTLQNGIRLYSFRYWNDERRFVGLIAQDLLADARFRDAVKTDASGYYVVDLKALGLGIAGDAEQFQAASRKALGAGL